MPTDELAAGLMLTTNQTRRLVALLGDRATVAAAGALRAVPAGQRLSVINLALSKRGSFDVAVASRLGAAPASREAETSGLVPVRSPKRQARRLTQEQIDTAIQFIRVTLPRFVPVGEVDWADVAVFTGREALDELGILRHQDCGLAPRRLPAGVLIDIVCAADDRMLVRQHLSGYQAGRVRVPSAAKALGIPQYILKDSTEPAGVRYQYQKLVPTVAADRFCELVRMKREQPSEFAQMVRDARQARKDAERSQRAVEAATAQLFVGFEAVRQQLGLAVWQTELASRIGLLYRHPEGYLLEDVAAIERDRDRFYTALARAEQINAPDACKILGVSRTHFDEIVVAGLLRPSGTGEFRYGTYSTYRRGDVDDLVSRVLELVAQRQAGIARRRSVASRQAQATRQRSEANRDKALDRVRRQAVGLAAVQDPLARALAMVGFWGTLVAAHADAERDRAGRTKSAKTQAAAEETSEACYAAKNQAQRALLDVRDLTRWRFLDGSRTWLCDSCRQDAWAAHVHPGDWDRHCEDCEIDHSLSLLECTISAAGQEYVMVIPVPIAEEWDVPEPRGPADPGSGVNLPAISRKQKKRPYRGQSVEELPGWIKSIRKRSRDRRDELGAYDTVVDETTLRAFPAPVAIESLQAAVQDLASLRAEAAARPDKS